MVHQMKETISSITESFFGEKFILKIRAARVTISLKFKVRI
jgi:hypothetical protein